MKKFYSLLAIAALTLSACDDIDDPIKTVAVGCSECVVDDNKSFVTQKAVFIEEFTGATCNNCPLATAAAKQLKDDHPGQVVVLAVHASNFAVPNPQDGYTADFRTTEGAEYFDFVQPFGVPSGTVDRIDQGSHLFAKPYQQWETKMDDILNASTEADLGIYAESSIDDVNNKICLEVHFKAMTDLSNDSIYWTAYLAESGIVAAQKQPDNSKDPDYVHNHVLRASFNGAFGEPIPDFERTLNSVACSSRSIDLDPNWVEENLEIMVMAYNFNTYEVLQVIELDL